jgi:hypothetical protein
VRKAKESLLLKNVLIVVFATAFLHALAVPGTTDPPAPESERPTPPRAVPMSKEDQAALELGRKVLAVRESLRNPTAPNALNAVTDLGRDQRHYVMVRGWLSYHLEGDLSIRAAAKRHAPNEVKERISFLRKAIRAIDLE